MKKTNLWYYMQRDGVQHLGNNNEVLRLKQNIQFLGYLFESTIWIRNPSG